MKKCKSCKSEIDKKATICPVCKTKQTNPVAIGISSLITIGIIIWVLSAVFGGSNNTQNTTANTQTKPQANTGTPITVQPTRAPIIVDAMALVGEYDKNKLAAQDKYTGKTIQTTGYIDNISSDIMGSYYLSLKPSQDQYYYGTTIQCYFNEKKQLTSLAKGQSLTVIGTMQDMSLGIVEMKECTIVK